MEETTKTTYPSIVRRITLAIVAVIFASIGALIAFGLFQLQNNADNGPSTSDMEPAPDFTVPLYSGGDGDFTLSDHLGSPGYRQLLGLLVSLHVALSFPPFRPSPTNTRTGGSYSSPSTSRTRRKTPEPSWRSKAPPSSPAQTSPAGSLWTTRCSPCPPPTSLPGTAGSSGRGPAR